MTIVGRDVCGTVALRGHVRAVCVCVCVRARARARVCVRVNITFLSVCQ